MLGSARCVLYCVVGSVCSGSGDYVCELCRIDVDGKIYSAGYLSASGRDMLPNKYKPYIRRPDREFALAAFIAFPLGFCSLMISELIVCIVYIAETRRVCRRDWRPNFDVRGTRRRSLARRLRWVCGHLGRDLAPRAGQL